MLEKIADSNWLPLWSRSSQDEGIDIISTNKDEIISDINTVGIIFLISLDRPYFITYVHMNASPWVPPQVLAVIESVTKPDFRL